VYFEDRSAGTLSNAAGRYALQMTDAGASEVSIRWSLIGYADETRTLVVDGSNLVADVALQAQSLRMDEVVVTGSAEQRKSPSEVRTRIAPEPAADMAAPPVSLGAPGFVNRFQRDPEFNTESYAHIAENGFVQVADQPLSTFSIDVDRASYANMRRFIRDGRRPPVDAVRIEEMINYFAYNYPDARGEHPFSVTTDAMVAPWNQEHLLVRVGLQGQRIDMSDAPPANLVFLLDVSGSMQSPDKLPLLKQAYGLLVDQLRPQDRVAIVVYAGAAGLVLPSTAGHQREVIQDAIAGLEAGGSTAGGQGLALAYKVAQENFVEGGNNRVVLATDGDFNVGPSSDGEMIRLVEANRDHGTFLTVLGFGTGNLKDSKMEQIANHGNGNYAYIDGLMEARKVLVTELGGTLLTIAKDVKLQVEFNPAAVARYRLIGYENRMLAARDFNDDRKDAGELGAGHSVTALYEVVPVGAGPVAGSVDPLRYGTNTDAEAPRATNTDELMFVKLRYKQPNATRSVLLSQAVSSQVSDDPSTDLRFAASVAGFGMLLRDSEHCGDLSLSDILELAASGTGPDSDGTRSEFVHLVKRTRDLNLLGG